MTSINTSYMNDVITPQDTVTELNNATSGQLGIIIVALTFFAGFIIFKNESTDNVLIYNGALTSTIAGGLILLGWISIEYLYIGLFMLGSGIVLHFGKKN